MTAAVERPLGSVRRARGQFRDSEYRQRLLLAYRRTGERVARERLVELYLPLVRALARRYARGGERFDDLVQVGAIGLLEAIERFDPERGCDFAAFAVPTVAGEMKNYIRDHTAVVRTPRRLRELTMRLGPSRDQLAVELRRSPTLDELATYAGVRVTEVEEAFESEQARAPLTLWSGAETDDLGRNASDDAFESTEDRLLLAAALRKLPLRERRIVHLRFFGGLSQSEIAAELGLSQIQVSRLIRRSLDRMRVAFAERSTEPR